MKIVSITMIKNESDILESFIRYNLNIFDEMIILDNGSTDDSLKIIANLQAENLPVVLIEDSDAYYNQNVKLTDLLKKAVNEYGADIVCPLDADEFLSSDVSNPRQTLENLDGNSYYVVRWQTYVPTASDNTEIKFIPSRIKHIRDDKYDIHYKVVVPRNMVDNFDVSIDMGSHNLIFKNPQQKPSQVMLHNLRIAHFPLRSIEQCMSKILVGWPNLIEKNKENSVWGHHWKSLFEKIRQNSSITYDDLEYFSKNYSLRQFSDDVEITEKRMNTDFCENIEIKYDYDYNYLRNLLDSYVYFVEELLSYKKQVEAYETEIKEYKEKIESYEFKKEHGL